MHHSLFAAASLFLLGVLVAPRMVLAPRLTWAVLCALVCGSILLARRRHRWTAHGCLLAAITTAGVLRWQMACPALEPTHVANVLATGPATVTGVLAADPTPTQAGLRVELRAEAVVEEARARPVTGTLQAAFPAGPAPLRYGDRVTIEGWVDEDSPGAMGPVLVIRARLPPRALGHAPGSRLLDWGLSLRRQLDGVLVSTHAPPVVPILRGVLLGMPVRDPAVSEALRRTGAYHLVTVSGLHLGVVLIAATVALGGMGLGRRARTVGGIGVVLVAVAMWGGGLPVLRAGVMAGAFALGRLMARPASIYTSLAMAALVIMAFDPADVTRAGFQLTFAAVLAIVYLTPSLMMAFDPLPSYLNALMSTAIAASLGTAPVLAVHFGTIPLVGPIVSLVAIPLMGVILPVGMLGLWGGLVSPWIAFFCGAANYGFVTLFEGTIRAMASMPWCEVDVAWVPGGAWALYGMTLVIAGDWSNIRGLLDARLTRAPEVCALPRPGDLPTEIVYRSARELLALLPSDRPADPVGARLFVVRDLFKAQALELAPDFRTRLEGLQKGPAGATLHSDTLRYLALADAYFLASRSPDRAPVLLLVLRALEHELNQNLLPLLRIPLVSTRARALAESCGDHPFMRFLIEPTRPMSLEEVDLLLWSMVTASQRPVRLLARLARRVASRRLSDPLTLFEASRLPLRIDQVYKKFYLRLDKQTWDWETVRKAREEILGPKQENLFGVLGRVLARPDASEPMPGQGA